MSCKPSPCNRAAHSHEFPDETQKAQAFQRAMAEQCSAETRAPHTRLADRPAPEQQSSPETSPSTAASAPQNSQPDRRTQMAISTASTGTGASDANQDALEQRFIALYEAMMEKQVSFKEAVEPFKTDNQNAGKG